MTDRRYALVTGATDGIGRATAARLAELGFTVLVHGRNKNRAEATAARLAGSVAVYGDFALMTQVSRLAQQVAEVAPHLDVLVNNAGMYSKQRETTADGFELTMAVNYFAPWLLTNLLLTRLLAAPQARVVNVSSMTHDGATLALDDLDVLRRWTAYGAYASSKLANILFSNALAERARQLRVNALHPGVIATKLLRAGFSMGGRDVAEGARTSLYLATEPTIASISGRYFVDCREQRPSKKAQNPELAARLWAVTEDRLGHCLAAVANE